MDFQMADWDGINVVGAFAIAGFLLGFVAAAAAYYLFNIGRQLEAHEGERLWVWKDPKARGQFLIFLGFCSLGVISGLLGLTLGGWPA